MNRTGSVQMPHLSELARKIWKWCKDRKLWIFASYISSKENVEADYASRIINIDTEWKMWTYLNDNSFKEIKNFAPSQLTYLHPG